MTPQFLRELAELMEANRDRALWSLARDFVPQTPAAARRVLEQIAARGDRATFIRARQLLRQLELEKHGYRLDVLRERPGFVEVLVGHPQEAEQVEMQWVRDSAFRFFPLIPHADLGLTLHPFDLATNKVLALVGRVEVRDWIDTLTCHEKVAPLALLAWAACGKDEGWNPQIIINEANRTAHYSREEVMELDWGNSPPDFVSLKTVWREAIEQARHYIALLPPEEVGRAVLDSSGNPFRGSVGDLQKSLNLGRLHFHEGHIGGAWPHFKAH